MLVMIDNYDSFVYNLTTYFKELNQDIKVIRNDKLTIEELESIENLDGIIISPGPGRPQDGGISFDIVRHFAGKLPILGVCLGHQIIGHAFGAVVKRGTVPMHGKVTPIHTTQSRMFSNLPETYEVTRYHSLVVDEFRFLMNFKLMQKPRMVQLWHFLIRPIRFMESSSIRKPF